MNGRMAPSAQLNIGFLPLTDAAALLAAVALGFDVRQGVRVRLSRENSWASLRDKLLVGVLDGAHILAPLAMAMHLGAGQVRKPMIAPVRLSIDGNIFVVSRDLRAALQAAGHDGSARRLPAMLALALPQLAAGRDEPATIATVFTHSSHHALMRRIVIEAGLVEERDVRLVVLPPSLMVEALQSGMIDGFCAGAPWGSVAVERQVGHIVATSSQFGSGRTEKLLAFPQKTYVGRRDEIGALCAAVIEAGEWCSDPDHLEELAAILSRPEYLDVETQLILRSLTGRLVCGFGEPATQIPDFIGVGGRYVARPDPAAAMQIAADMDALAAGVCKEALEEVLNPEIFDRLAKARALAGR